MENPLKVTEIIIPVPWGVIAGKTYGDPLNIPVLCVHGIQDNCDTFVRLIPLLPKYFYYVCIDLPGHGKSSHFGEGLVLDLLMYVFAVKRVVDHFNWTKIHYIAHSLGGNIGIYFACLFSEHVEKMVSIDAFPPQVIDSNDTVKTLQKKYLNLFAIEERLRTSQPPSYTMNEVVERVTKNRDTEMRPEHALMYVQRSLVQTEPNMFRFTTDQRLKMALDVLLNNKQVEELLKDVRCPFLVIEANIRNRILLKYDNRFYQTCLAKQENVTFYDVEGDHDVHLLHPERIAPVIQSFFLTTKSNL